MSPLLKAVGPADTVPLTLGAREPNTARRGAVGGNEALYVLPASSDLRSNGGAQPIPGAADSEVAIQVRLRSPNVTGLGSITDLILPVEIDDDVREEY